MPAVGLGALAPAAVAIGMGLEAGASAMVSNVVKNSWPASCKFKCIGEVENKLTASERRTLLPASWLTAVAQHEPLLAESI